MSVTEATTTSSSGPGEAAGVMSSRRRIRAGRASRWRSMDPIRPDPPVMTMMGTAVDLTRPARRRTCPVLPQTRQPTLAPLRRPEPGDTRGCAAGLPDGRGTAGALADPGTLPGVVGNQLGAHGYHAPDTAIRHEQPLGGAHLQIRHG